MTQGNAVTEPAQQLAGLVAQTRYEDLPSEVIERAKMSILDTLAVIIAGSSQAGIGGVVNLVRGWGGAEESTILLYGGKVPAPNAAFANGPMARALDMGDVHEEGGHVGEYILPASLAAAELRAKRGQPVTGKELIAAYALGGEVLARIGLGCRAISAAAGKNPQMGSFGAAVAVAKLLDFDANRIWNALGIAYVSISCLDAQMYHEGSLMCRVHHAHVCRDGLLAALLTEEGITGVKKIFTGDANFYLLYYPGSGDHARITKELGTKWEFAEGTMLKPYMCCKLFHTAIYAVTSIIQESDLDPLAIEEIDVRVCGTAPPPFFVRPNYNPQTFVEGQFSAPWCIASGAIDGHLFLDSYTDIFRDDVRKLTHRVKFSFDESLPKWSVIVMIVIGGKRYAKRVDYCLGHPNNPVDWEWLREKLDLCAAHSITTIPEGVLEQLARAIRNLEEVGDTGEIIRLLTPATVGAPKDNRTGNRRLQVAL